MIRHDRRGAVHVVTLEHGPVNTLDVELLRALAEVFDGASGAADGAGAVVLTGAGTCFSAGVDLRRLLDGGRDDVADLLTALESAILAVLDHPVPVVAAVNGHAVAGGCVLVQACDVRIMSSGRISLPELSVGVVLPPVALEVVRWAVPDVEQAVLSGRAHDADQARQAGLVDEVVPGAELLDRAVEVAADLSRLPAKALRLTRRQLRRQVHAALAGVPEDEREAVLEVWAGPEARRRMAATLQARRRA